MTQLAKDNAAAAAAAPRPSRANLEEPPLFLRKTYEMIDTCPRNLGGWSSSGDTFVVYDAETFATMWIPRFFRHNKFSSFVRQLNFYGFRKVRSDEHGLRRDANGNGRRNWEFRHDLFKKGRPELMRLINRRRDRDNGGVNAAQQQELIATRTELVGVKRRCQDLEKAVTDLKTLVQSLATQVAANGGRLQAAETQLTKVPVEREESATAVGALLSEFEKKPLNFRKRACAQPTVPEVEASWSDEEVNEENPARKKRKFAAPKPDLDAPTLGRLPSLGMMTHGLLSTLDALGDGDVPPPVSNPQLSSLTSTDLRVFESMLDPEQLGLQRFTSTGSATEVVRPDTPEAGRLAAP